MDLYTVVFFYYFALDTKGNELVRTSEAHNIKSYKQCVVIGERAARNAVEYGFKEIRYTCNKEKG